MNNIFANIKIGIIGSFIISAIFGIVALALNEPIGDVLTMVAVFTITGMTLSVVDHFIHINIISDKELPLYSEDELTEFDKSI
jgi:hypothetical protein